ncbi:TRAUB-domain-containing protein [Xylona heveae TC161]|uniref:Protein BFR2 n=1 Tax=Xylona heveae (strain CBS 132557 / TC161) TaxID=1328760 RepID=A0A165FIH7_XYLHT|nr:TRAUB-domain-containing protein [Xylona heveae TC161]KZF21014.1 TRAUB-domain-containing protein [Xylona heveae TC161]
MAKAKRTKTLAEQIADLEDPAPKDFDPEDQAEHSESEDGAAGSEDEEFDGREHYVNVDKSKLRKKGEVPLGPQYEGARVSRSALEGEESDDDPFASGRSGDENGSAESDADEVEEDSAMNDAAETDDEIDSDEALGESDAEKFKDFTFRGSSKPRERKIDDVAKANGVTHESHESDSDEELSQDDEGSASNEDDNGEDDSENESQSDQDEIDDDEDEESEDGEESEDEDEPLKDEDSERAALREMMSSEQKNVTAIISQAAKVDAEKGEAVKQQRQTFSTLLNTRIRLQKALVATNTFSAADDASEADAAAVRSAEEAALSLWNTLDSFRVSLSSARTGSKRKHSAIDIDNASPESLWSRMQEHESQLLPARKLTLEKWSAKVRSANAAPVTRKLNTASEQTITDVLTSHLANSERLVKRTQIPRSCAPLQASKGAQEIPEVYDDADFYSLLLKELVDQRMADSAAAASETFTGASLPAQWEAARSAKTKRNVDTKASKGRKLRYTVHEKLQDFMVPEDRGTWEDRQIDELFGSLLGKQMELNEDEGDEEEALMLFRSKN